MKGNSILSKLLYHLIQRVSGTHFKGTKEVSIGIRLALSSISLAEVIQKFKAAVVEVCCVHGVEGGIAQFPKKKFVE